MMALNTLRAISPIDGRYYKQVSSLSDYFSEYAYIRARVFVEIEYFIALCELPLPELSILKPETFNTLRSIYQTFSETDAQHIKEIEQTTNHDVKAVEYFLKEVFDKMGLSEYKEFIHFGLTSQDINNTAIPYLMQSFHEEVFIHKLTEVRNKLNELANTWNIFPCCTHPRPSGISYPVGKELCVCQRLNNQLELLKSDSLLWKIRRSYR